MSTSQPVSQRTPDFSPPKPDRTSNPVLPWAIAGLVVLALVGALLFVSHRHVAPSSPNALLPLDPYAQNLTFSGLQMSESTSLSGGKSTYIDGHVRNTGQSTVKGATLQVLFGSFDTTAPPQIETVPLNLIRTHEPYVDTQPVTDAPLARGDDREFRLIFEDISPNWNQQLPEIHPVKVQLR